MKRVEGAILLGLCLGPAHAATYPLPPPDEGLVGAVTQVVAREQDTLVDIARQHRLGYDELVRANPTVDHWLPVEGTTVLLPTRYVLPPGPRRGIVVNIPEFRLYYYPKSRKGHAPEVVTYAVSAGREDWQTPSVQTEVSRRLRNPAWYPPKTIRDEHQADGHSLPAVVPPGPDNPLGPLALKLGIPGGYFIHGTSKPFGIGLPVTHGCLRLYPEDMQELFEAVREGTPVRVIKAPYKTAWQGGVLYVEVHSDPEERAAAMRPSVEAALGGHADYDLDWDQERLVALLASGVPTVLQRRAPVKAAPPP